MADAAPTWTIDEALNRFGMDDDEETTGSNAPDWHCILVNRTTYGMARHLFLQFPRPGIDRAAADEIVRRILAGLNA